MPTVDLTGRHNRWYGWLDWPGRLAALTLLWIAGVLAGAVVVGVAPATLAGHRLIRDWLEHTDVRPWAAYWSSWRAWIVRGQLVLGFPLATTWVIAFYTLALRDTVWAIGLAVLLAGYLITIWLLPGVASYRTQASIGQIWQVTADLTWRRPLLPVCSGVVLISVLGATWYVAPGVLVLTPALVLAASGWVVRRQLSSRQLPRDDRDPTRSDLPAR
jgi:uncharacterized membrane protein YesL